jgi:hypothetical protein
MMSPVQPGTLQAMGKSREQFLSQLTRLPNRHLVLVRYQPGHNALAEWVYNEADIDHSKVVWARDLGPEQNEELVRYFKNRKVWLLVADDTSPTLVPYPETPPLNAKASLQLDPVKTARHGAR